MRGPKGSVHSDPGGGVQAKGVPAPIQGAQGHRWTLGFIWAPRARPLPLLSQTWAQEVSVQMGSLAQMWGSQEVTECPQEQRCQLYLVGFGHLMPEKEQMSTGVPQPCTPHPAHGKGSEGRREDSGVRTGSLLSGVGDSRRTPELRAEVAGSLGSPQLAWTENCTYETRVPAPSSGYRDAAR